MHFAYKTGEFDFQTVLKKKALRHTWKLDYKFYSKLQLAGREEPPPADSPG